MNGTTADTADMPRLERGARTASLTAVYVRFIAEHDQWYADAADFQIVGIGETREAAVASMKRLMAAHLRSAARRDADPRRPESTWASWRLRLVALMSLPLPQGKRAVRRVRL